MIMLQQLLLLDGVNLTLLLQIKKHGIIAIHNMLQICAHLQIIAIGMMVPHQQLLQVFQELPQEQQDHLLIHQLSQVLHQQLLQAHLQVDIVKSTLLCLHQMLLLAMLSTTQQVALDFNSAFGMTQVLPQPLLLLDGVKLILLHLHQMQIHAITHILQPTATHYHFATGMIML